MLVDSDFLFQAVAQVALPPMKLNEGLYALVNKRLLSPSKQPDGLATNLEQALNYVDEQVESFCHQELEGTGDMRLLDLKRGLQDMDYRVAQAVISSTQEAIKDACNIEKQCLLTERSTLRNMLDNEQKMRALAERERQFDEAIMADNRVFQINRECLEIETESTLLKTQLEHERITGTTFLAPDE